MPWQRFRPSLSLYLAASGNGPSHGAGARTTSDTGISCARSYRTLRDGSFEDAFPGTSCQARIGVSLRDGLADDLQRHLARERASNYVIPFVGPKTSQTALNLAPYNPGLGYFGHFGHGLETSKLQSPKVGRPAPASGREQEDNRDCHPFEGSVKRGKGDDMS
jgi:hypothetical protein